MRARLASSLADSWAELRRQGGPLRLGSPEKVGSDSDPGGGLAIVTEGLSKLWFTGTSNGGVADAVALAFAFAFDFGTCPGGHGRSQSLRRHTL